jgi:hypothetical protein
LATDGLHISGYDPVTLDAVLGEAGHLLRHLGFAAAHTVVIGGVVPSLLVLDPPGQPHIGTTDLDLCLSLALVDGDTGQYERIETQLKKAGYQPTDVSFRWRQTDRLKLVVEFFCPAGDGREPGRMFRPRAADNPVARHNIGGKLAPLALAEGPVITADVVTVPRQVTLPADGGITTITFRVCGLLGFLAAKVGALKERNKPKDAYDIVWIIENWPGGPDGAAQAILASPAYTRPDVPAVLASLFEEFSAHDRLGPRSYATFQADPDADRDERTRWARHAAGTVQALHQSMTALVG